MSYKSAILSAVLLALTAVQGRADGNVGRYGSDTEISDLALIYAGAERRPAWTKQQLQPYLTHVYADGHEDWFFDGFLFLEFSVDGVAFGNGSGLPPALQDKWQWLIDDYFTPGVKLHALDELIDETTARLGTPPLRHKVVITCCAPTKLQSGNWSRGVWGTVDGRELKFAYAADRVAAVKWYVDTVLEAWQKAQFRNLDLAGFYWIEEGLFSNGEIMPQINDYIHSLGLRSYWIPYYPQNQTWWSQWSDTYRFDMCYIQPNYAFYNDDLTTKPFSQLTATVDAAKAYGMGLELEFETQGASNALHSVNPTLHSHINDYMDVYDDKGVFADAGVAYYSGTQGFIHMHESTDPVDHATIDRMASFVAARQKARSAGIRDAVADTCASPYTRHGQIVLPTDSCCHDIAGRLVFHGSGTVACEPGIYIVRDIAGHTHKLLVD